MTTGDEPVAPLEEVLAMLSAAARGGVVAAQTALMRYWQSQPTEPAVPDVFGDLDEGRVVPLRRDRREWA